MAEIKNQAKLNGLLKRVQSQAKGIFQEPLHYFAIRKGQLFSQSRMTGCMVLRVDSADRKASLDNEKR